MKKQFLFLSLILAAVLMNHPVLVYAMGKAPRRTVEPHQAVVAVLDNLQNAYEAAQGEKFFDGIDANFPDRVRFREDVERDFVQQKNTRLHYRIEEKGFSADGQEAIYKVFWQKKFQNPSGQNFSDSNTMIIKFEKNGATWNISALENNTIFGSAE